MTPDPIAVTVDLAAVGGWLAGQNVFGITVERHDFPRLHGKPFYPVGKTGRGVIHTTEGSTIAGAISILVARGDGPTFLCGEGRIIQGRPLGFQSGALRQNPGSPPTNQLAEVQIENIGYSQTKLWLFDDWANHVYLNNQGHTVPIPIPNGSTLKPLSSVLAWLTKNTDIPLQRPNPNWKDDCSDMPLPWSREGNARRVSGTWDDVTKKGWFGHGEVQHQEFTDHWDPGCLNWTMLFDAANDLLEVPDSP